VNGQAGNDSWDGLSRAYDSGTGSGPKETINAAIYVSSSTGDLIEVNYANGLAYNIVDPGLLTPGTATHVGKQITFTSYGGTPTVNSWTITANTTFTGNFIIGTKLWLKGNNSTSCQVTGGNFLTMKTGAELERTLGSIASGQLQFAGTCKFTYDGGKPSGVPMVTGLEMPISTNTGVVSNLNVLIPVAPASGDSTVLQLSEGKTMNGILTQNTGCNIHLDGYDLTLAQTASNTHVNNGDILNGELVVIINSNTLTVTLQGDRILPNVTATAASGTGRKLLINTSKRIGEVTAAGVAHIDMPLAGQTNNIGGIVNSSTGTILVGGTAAIDGRTVDPLGWVRALNGTIFFDNPGTVDLG